MRAFFRRQLKLATVRSETIKSLLHTALDKLDLKPGEKEAPPVKRDEETPSTGGASDDKTSAPQLGSKK